MFFKWHNFFSLAIEAVLNVFLFDKAMFLNASIMLLVALIYFLLVKILFLNFINIFPSPVILIND